MKEIKRAYRWLWTRIGGRPWTYILRDIYHQAEWLIQMVWFCIGAAVGIYFGWVGVAIFIIIYSFGYLNGHLYWGKKWIKGQEYHEIQH